MATVIEDDADGERKAADGGAIARSGTSYPYYGLQEAVRVASAVQRAGGNEATDDDLRRELNLTSKTSRGWSYRLSSAREFGLIERAGRAQDARVRITPLFKRYAMPENEAEKKAALVDALLTPPLYKKLMDRYRGAPVPDAVGVANLLVREYGLLDSVKNEAAEAFVDSLRFAGVIGAGNIVMANLSAGASTPAPPPVEKEKPAEDVGPPRGQRTLQVPAGFIPHVFQLRREMQIVVPLPPDLSAKDVERLHRWMQTLPIEEDQKPM